MKISKDFIIHNTESESLLVPTGNAAFSGIVRGNRTFGTILELLKNETEEAALISALAEKYDAPKSRLAQDVRRAITELRSVGALEE